jgi:hypothetical protein
VAPSGLPKNSSAGAIGGDRDDLVPGRDLVAVAPNMLWFSYEYVTASIVHGREYHLGRSLIGAAKARMSPWGWIEARRREADRECLCTNSSCVFMLLEHMI